MLIVAERINATRKGVARALEERDAAYVAGEAKRQAAAGAGFIDLNAGRRAETETDDLCWLVDVVRDAVEVPLALDSANPASLEAALRLVDGEVLLNSVTAESSKMDVVLELAASSGAKLVALTMDDKGMPDTVERRVEIAIRIGAAAEAKGIGPERLYFDPLIRPVSSNPEQVDAVLESVGEIKRNVEGSRTIVGLSNISFGLPKRRLLNASFLVMATAAGLDAAILDPTEPGLVGLALAAEALAGRDDYCMNYIAAERSGLLG